MNIDFDCVKGKKIFVATPCYGGSATAYYTRSMIQLATLCAKNDIELSYYALTSESLITRARNYSAAEFLKSNAEYLIFIDSDIQFNPLDVIALVALSEKNSEYDVICGAYPLKTIAWDKIKYAVDKGVADKDENILSKYAVDFVFNIDKSVKSVKLNEPLQVSEAGTGFMCIKRNVFLKFQDNYPEYEYTPDHTRSENFNGDNKIFAYFDTCIDKDTNRYLSEDYFFCRMISKIGMKVWICPWMQLNHIGNYIYEGRLDMLASIGLSHNKSKGLK